MRSFIGSVNGACELGGPSIDPDPLTHDTTLFPGGYALLRTILYATCESDPLAETTKLMKKFGVQEAKQGIKVESVIDSYNRLQDDAVTTQRDRNLSVQTLVNAYYDLATLFYEWGWGQSFHFANRHKDETFAQSIKRHEYYLASRLVSRVVVPVLLSWCRGGCESLHHQASNNPHTATPPSLAHQHPIHTTHRTASRRARSCWTAAAGWAGPCGTSRASRAPTSRVLPSTSTRWPAGTSSTRRRA